MSDAPTAISVIALLEAAQQAAARCDWVAVLAAAGCLRSPARSPDVQAVVKLLLLQGQAHHKLQAYPEALQVCQNPTFKSCHGKLPVYMSAATPRLSLPTLQLRDVRLSLLPQSLDLALQLIPACAEGLWLRAAAHAACGHHTASFMDLRSLSQHNPTYPGLTTALQRAAQAVAKECAARPTAKAPPRRTYVHTTRRAPGPGSAPHQEPPGVQQLAYSTLGLQPGASLQAVRQAYKQRAAQLHPDKWVLAGSQQRAAAEEQFKQVAAAYQSIMASLQH